MFATEWWLPFLRLGLAWWAHLRKLYSKNYFYEDYLLGTLWGRSRQLRVSPSGPSRNLHTEGLRLCFS